MSELKLQTFANGKWTTRETFTWMEGAPEYAAERAADWRRHGNKTRLNPCPTCMGKGFVNPDGSPVNAFTGSDSDPVRPCPSRLNHDEDDPEPLHRVVLPFR